jgi:tRNA (cytidine/uridine-2'-O-)-methyltransferase
LPTGSIEHSNSNGLGYASQPEFDNMNIPLHIVLYQPEIPPNTGNIARLCACTGCQLHLVHPLGFSLDEKQLRRAGLDYWEYLEVKEYPDWQRLRDALGEDRNWYALSTKATILTWEVEFEAGDVLVLGPESRGLPDFIRQQITPVKLAMRSDAPVRSLNLSSACSAVVYEALRQINITK